jgi:tRNA (guanine-N7-)-methyltransferase
VRAFVASRVPAPLGLAPFSAQGEGPLDLEIGCGVGWHPIAYALAHPERRVIAIEHTRTRFEAFERRVSRHREKGIVLSNLFPVQARAEAWVAHALPEACLDRVFLLYPNPYPKTSDLNKRWPAMPFMGFLLSRLKEGGTLELRTNEAFYFEEARRLFASKWGTREILAESWCAAPERPPETHFERKYLEAGQTCHRLVVSKSDLGAILTG